MLLHHPRCFLFATGVVTGWWQDPGNVQGPHITSHTCSIHHRLPCNQPPTTEPTPITTVGTAQHTRSGRRHPSVSPGLPAASSTPGRSRASPGSPLSRILTGVTHRCDHKEPGLRSTRRKSSSPEGAGGATNPDLGAGYGSQGRKPDRGGCESPSEKATWTRPPEASHTMSSFGFQQSKLPCRRRFPTAHLDGIQPAPPCLPWGGLGHMSTCGLDVGYTCTQPHRTEDTYTATTASWLELLGLS